MTELRSARVLELGAGSGFDAGFLNTVSSRLVCCDLRTARWRNTSFNEIPFVCIDHSQPLPFRDQSFDVVVAGLCLHYFHWSTTVDIVARLARLLVPGGLLLGRVNSEADVNHGAGEGDLVETGLYLVPHSGHAQQKRFFNEAMVRAMLDGWQLEHLVETQFRYVDHDKAAWEFAARVTR